VQSKVGKAASGRSEGQAVSFRGHKSGPRAVSSFLPGLTRKSFEKYGFATANMVTDWAKIVGPEMAAYSAPERLKWTRAVDPHDELTESGNKRSGATLVLRVEGSRALDLQYRSRQLIERVNSYFGYRAVAELRFIQAPLARSNEAPRPKVSPPRNQPVEVSPELQSIKDDSLKSALSRLQRSVRAKSAVR
jgi:hypothetical protein